MPGAPGSCSVYWVIGFGQPMVLGAGPDFTPGQPLFVMEMRVLRWLRFRRTESILLLRALTGSLGATSPGARGWSNGSRGAPSAPDAARGYPTHCPAEPAIGFYDMMQRSFGSFLQSRLLEWAKPVAAAGIYRPADRRRWRDAVGAPQSPHRRLAPLRLLRGCGAYRAAQHHPHRAGGPLLAPTVKEWVTAVAARCEYRASVSSNHPGTSAWLHPRKPTAG